MQGRTEINNRKMFTKRNKAAKQTAVENAKQTENDDVKQNVADAAKQTENGTAKQTVAEYLKPSGLTPVETLKKLIFISKEYIPWYIGLLIAAIAVSAIGLLETEGLRRIVNGTTTGDKNLLVNGVIISLIAFGTGQVIEFTRGYFGEILNFISIRNLQSVLISKLTRALMKGYDSYHTGDLIDRISNSSEQAQSGLNNNAVNILQNLVLLVFIIMYLVSVNIKMTLASIIFIIALPLIVNPLSKKLRVLHEENQKVNAEKSAFIQDAVQGAEVVRVYLLTSRLSQSLNKIYEKLAAILKKLIPYESFMYSSHVMVIVTGDFFILGFGGYLVSKGELQVGDVIAFLLLFERMFQPLSYISTVWPQFQSSIVAANRVFEVLNLPEETDAANVTPIPEDGDICFDDIFFSYSGKDNRILNGITFTAEKGKVTAIVGPSGSGKSTIIKLLLRLYETDKGQISFGGIDIRNFKHEDWRSKMSYVSQDASLFSGSIKENILYGRTGADMNEVKNAATAACIDDFIEKSEKDYDSLIGEKGVRLSGGERQRISIARAVISSPEILVLDEPTSSLDNENERMVLKALNNLMTGRTTIVVAHRLSTIKNADQIVYIEDGIVAESGTHDELMCIKGKYYNMYSNMISSEIERDVAI